MRGPAALSVAALNRLRHAVMALRAAAATLAFSGSVAASVALRTALTALPTMLDCEKSQC
jgi:hypothetical protein